MSPKALPIDEVFPSKKPKPSLHLEKEDVTGEIPLSVGEHVTLSVRGKITSVNEEEYGDEDKKVRTFITLRLSDIKVADA